MAAQKMFVDQFADRIIEAMEKGQAPWQKSWKAGEIVAPFNPATGKRYSGANLVTLMARRMETGSADSRYMTAKQARDNGFEIRAGAVGVPIQYWQTAKGRPLARVTTVFHASEIEGMPAWDAAEKSKAPDFERAEKMLRNSNVKFAFDNASSGPVQSRYSRTDDTIHLPERPSFEPETYYMSAVHELARAAGHPDRMNTSSSPRGSEAHAREELRAEIAAWILAADLGLGFKPGQQMYVGECVEALKKDPHEAMRACRDAEKIATYVKSLENSQELSAEQKSELVADATSIADESAAKDAPEVPKDVLPGEESPVAAESEQQAGQQGKEEKKTWLNVPYTQRYLAKNAGARLDREAKLWYAPEGSDLEKLQRWMPENALTAEKAALSPQEEFARALRDAGLDLKGQMPLMDGQIHRVPLLDGRSGKLDGMYKGFLDGIPAGFIENWKTGEKDKWKYSGHMLSGEQIHKLRLDAAEKREAEARETAERHDKAAKRCFAIWKNCDWADKDHSYLSQKQVGGFGVKVDAQGNLIVPGRNAAGGIRTILTITPELKKFEPGAEVKGAFHLIDPDKRQESTPLILIAEGYATAASVHMGTGMPVICAFNTNNLKAVAMSLREKYPDKPIVFMADDDHQQEKNPGITKAWEAAKEVGGKVISPDFTPEEKARGLTDFNDLHVSSGLTAVFDQIVPGLTAQSLESSLRTGIPKARTDAEKKAQVREKSGKAEGMSR